MKKKAYLLFLLLPFLALGAFVGWAETPLGPMPEALAALDSGGGVQVVQTPWLVFSPAGGQGESGLIFYPGGRIDPRSYSPAARRLAEAGFLVVIPPMPLNLAVLDAKAAEEIIGAFPKVQHWAVGGHSLGGAMAADFALKNPDRVQGLVLWASYPASSADLSGLDLEVVSIYGSRDAVSDRERVEAARAQLPSSTRWVLIEGGNHAQFGWYGDQPGDGVADISRADQQAEVVAATQQLLEAIGGQP